MQYPETVITEDKKGNKEVRVLVDKGRFVRYKYMNPETGKIVENGKTSIILKNEEGEEEHLYFIPLPNGKELVVRPKESAKPKDIKTKERRVWDKEKNKAVELFD